MFGATCQIHKILFAINNLTLEEGFRLYINKLRNLGAGAKRRKAKIVKSMLFSKTGKRLIGSWWGFLKNNRAKRAGNKSD